MYLSEAEKLKKDDWFYDDKGHIYRFRELGDNNTDFIICVTSHSELTMIPRALCRVIRSDQVFPLSEANRERIKLQFGTDIILDTVDGSRLSYDLYKTTNNKLVGVFRHGCYFFHNKEAFKNQDYISHFLWATALISQRELPR